MSGYFDALIRSSGMAIGRSRPVSAQPEPAAIDVQVDHGTTRAEAKTVHQASLPHQLPTSLDMPDSSEPAVPPRARGRLDRYAHEKSDRASARSLDAAEPAADSSGKPSAAPLEPPKPDLGHTLVRAAMRWVAAGTPQESLAGAVNSVYSVNRVSPINPVNPVETIAPSAPRRKQSLSAVDEQTSTIATKRRHRDDDGTDSESANGRQATPAFVNVAANESVAATPLPIRASLVAPASQPPVAASVRDDIVEVSIGAIHVRVDAPQAQTVARSAPTPAASAPDARTSRPSRSALSRRALRRI